MPTLSIKALFFAVLVVLLTACNLENRDQGVQSAVVKSDVPDLVQRSTKIQLGKEWDGVQNTYQDKVLALKKNPQDAEAKIHLANIFIKEARVTGEHGHYYPAALKMLNSVLSQDELDNDSKFIALMHKAGVQLSLHEFSSALQTGQEAVKLNPRNAQIYGVLVDSNVELGNYGQAVKLSDKMIQLKPDLRSYSRVSYLRQIHGDIPGAYQAMKMAAEAGYPGTEETAWTMLTLGELYAQHGESEKATSIFNQILEMRADYPFAIGALAELQYEKGNLKEAEKLINEAIEIIPEVGFYVTLAHLYKDTDRKAELKEITKEIFLMLEDDVVHGHNMNLEYADIHLNLLDDPKSALEYVNKEYEKRPANIDVNRMMAEVYLALDDLDQTKTYAAAASVTDSKDPALLKIKAALN